MWENYTKLQPFEAHEVMRCTKYATPGAVTRDNYYRFEDPLMREVPENLKRPLMEKCGEFYRVVGTVSSIDKSIRKTDKPRCIKYKKNVYWGQAKDFTWNMFFEHLEAMWKMTTMDEIWMILDLDTAAGTPWALLGFRKKKDFFSSEYCIHFLFDDPRKYHPPVWKFAGKTEWYPLSKLLSGDVRTFIIPPMQLLYFQKVLYHAQNMAVKLFKWSMYGFDPYHGGTARLGKELCKNSKFICYDVGGWDRLLPILRSVYRLRNQAIPEAWHWLAKWVTENTVASYLLLPDGRIIYKDAGNNSGSGNTTVDNIIAHAFIAATWLLDLFDGNVDKLDEAVVALYGDDNVSSIPDCGKSDEQIEQTLRSTFADFGLTLDPLKITNNLSECEFLGFKFTDYHGNWIPQYNIDRLLTAFCYDYETMPIHAALSKAFSLTVMAAGGDEETFERMREVLRFYFNLLRDRDDTTIQAYIHLGAPTREECIAFYMGWESGYDPKLDDFIHWRKEVHKFMDNEFEWNDKNRSPACEAEGT